MGTTQDRRAGGRVGGRFTEKEVGAAGVYAM